MPPTRQPASMPPREGAHEQILAPITGKASFTVSSLRGRQGKEGVGAMTAVGAGLGFCPPPSPPPPSPGGDEARGYAVFVSL
jgi:hypothetical protein